MSPRKQSGARGLEKWEELQHDLGSLRKMPEFASLWRHLEERRVNLGDEITSQEPHLIDQRWLDAQLGRINELGRIIGTPKEVRQQIEDSENRRRPFKSGKEEAWRSSGSG